MHLHKQKILMKSFFNSQFNYCPMIWIFHNRHLNNKINRLHERCLRHVYNDKSSRFEELLTKDISKDVSIHHRNIQNVIHHEVKNGSSPAILNELIQLREDSH